MPARVRVLIPVLATFGVRLEPPRGGGSHWKATSIDGNSYVIPCPRGEKTELADVYVRGLCRAMGIDYAELKRHL